MKKKLLFAAFVAGLLAIGGLLRGQTALAVDNFVIKDFDVLMELGRDSDGRSTLRTVETITADFSRAGENHGLERIVVKNYDKHSTSFKLLSVTDENGKNLPYHWVGDALRIGDPDVYVQGLHTYKITYTQRDVTKYYESTKYDEFYWDAIGVEWRVPIEQATVRLRVASDIQSLVKSDTNCYTGQAGSTALCNFNKVDGAYVVHEENLRGWQGITVALGFSQGTFAAYQPSLIERLFRWWVMLTVVTSIVGVGIIIFLSVRAYRWRYRASEVGTIIPEYLPPKNASVAASAAVLPEYSATLAAQLTDLAVRHYIQILETKPKRSFLQPAEYDIKVVRDISDLRDEEKEILSDLFGHMPQPGDRMALKTLQNNTAAYMRFSDNDRKLRDLQRKKYSFDHIDEKKRGWFGGAAKLLFVLAIVTLSPVLLIASIVAFVISKTLWVLSDEGLELSRYLKGLALYIKVAESERIAMLQSPEGAEKVGVSDPTDPAQLVKLYERALPYAILFRQEKEWSKRLGDYYEKTQGSPDWYTGNTAFNAAVFSSMMTNFSTSASTVSSSSSSTGGSSGGGFSGGGGGGGGGGGW